MAQTIQQKARITNQYNKQVLMDLEQTFSAKAKKEKQEAVQMAQQKGWEVKINLEDGRYAELQKVTKTGEPIYYITYNVDAAESTRTNWLNSGGGLGLNLNGDNMTAHVWDGGLALASHQEYDGPGGTNRFSVGDGTSTTNYHSAHVTGTIMASGVDAQAKGMAPHANAVGYDWSNDLSEATNAAASGMLVSNHSYGYRGDQLPDWYFGAYIEESRDWDNLMYNSPYYMMVVAAGNDGNQDTYNGSPLEGNSAYDKLSGHSTSKNNLVVANAQDANIDSNGNLISVSINSSSSEGPTDDYRIKPDITGNGTGVYSTYESSNTAYNSITGTSMASPNVAGSILILQEHANNLFGNYVRAATLKGVVLHTADDKGIAGPDAIWGWGLMNAKRAAETMTGAGTSSKVEELTLNNGQTYSVTIESDGTSPLLASISWTDQGGTANTGTTNDNTPVLVNDLDIRVTQNSTTYSPYRLTGVNSNSKGDNNVDPFERVDINNASGSYTITVSHKGSLASGSQDFSLVVTGVSGQPVVCNATTPTSLTASNVGSNSADLTWDAVTGTTYDVRYRVSGTSTWTTESVTSSSLTLSGLSSTTQYEAQVRSKCSDGTLSAYSSSVSFTTTEVQLVYCGSNGNSVADEYIGRVQLGSLDNSSGAASSGYADFTSISTELGKGDANTITITPTWTGTIYSEGYSVWIDYNQDGDFADAGEQVWTQSATKNTPVGGSFTVPTSALSGNTTMRVSMKYNGIPTSCESFSYGEVEDYTVNITTGTPEECTIPTSLSASSIGETTATLSWSSESAANDYTVRVRVSGTSSWSTLAASSNSVNVSGLTADTQYEWQVRSNCSSSSSNYSSSSLFTTAAPAPLEYCASQGNNSSYEWIQRVVLGSIDNTSGDNGGYADFTNLSADLPRGTSTSMNVQAGFSGSSYTEYWSIWIDLNQDGTFSSGERLVNGSSSSSNLLSATLNIPSTALTGSTRMRVTMKYNAQATPCEAFAYGEVEDYTVNITNSTASMVATSSDLSGEALGNEDNIAIYSLYPNPAQDKLNVNIKNIDASKGIQIYSSNGALVRSINTGKEINTIDVSSLEKGMYILKANTVKEAVSANFIVK
ncbi:GEVED domain-containing protein [Marivirga sp.]|uniref:GEVED domain-containing protein n=1 Tax=Marivirga sp. TaxID=2018662 RepID=UPI0025CCA5F6|nr:GEVED domain-containing protein [Marivirga sp.]